MTVIQKYRSYRFGSSNGLLCSQMDELIHSFGLPGQKASGVLPGRIQVQTKQLDGTGPVVIKPYFRGGLLRHVNTRTYLWTGKFRSREEFERLCYVRQIGVNAPEPVAFAVKGLLVYHAWLVTRQIPGAVSLSEICLSSPGQAGPLLPAVVEQIRTLIGHGIHHVDLHPGNVLVDHSGRVYFIDFDSAGTARSNKKRLKRLYAQRWGRAVEKYGLPEFVKKKVETGILR